MRKTSKKAAPTHSPMRYAHPYYTSKPPAQRTPHPTYPGKRMTDWTSMPAKLGPIPKPTTATSTMELADIIGAPGVKEIQDVGTLRFHCVGDTGRISGTPQEDVAAEMTNDFHPDGGGNNPALFIHLGDVIYGGNKESAYLDEFYRPYKNYPGKIIAVPGNHDGEVLPTDPKSLQAFEDNFCAPSAVVPTVADQARILRETATQPGVYWLLDAPFVQFIGLYSNIAEGPGYLEGQGGDKSQTDWLAATLGDVAAQRKAGSRKALIIGVHHPPYSTAGHVGSQQMLTEIDAACTSAGIMPDALLAGHSHTYQRYTRRLSFAGTPMEIPFVVAGCGGHNDQKPVPATGQVMGDHTYEKAMQGYGYLMVSASPQRLTVEMWQAPQQGSSPFDSVSVDLATNRLV
jgi:calcineurin-like phosphoesterase family protein